MIVDAHVHLFPPEVLAERDVYVGRDGWFGSLYGQPSVWLASVEDLLASMDSAGVDRSIVASFPWAEQELCQAHNAYFRELGKRDRLSFLCTVQPRAGQQAIDELKRCLDDGSVGLGEMNVDAQQVELEEDCWGLLAECLIDAGATLLLHCSEPVGHAYPGKGHNTPGKVYRFALEHPGLRIVAAHWGGGLPFYYLMPELPNALPNVYYDSAATEYLYDKRAFRTFAQIAGSDRLLFGSDFPLLTQERALRHARSGELSAGDEQAFLGVNAAAVYIRPG